MSDTRGSFIFLPLQGSAPMRYNALSLLKLKVISVLSITNSKFLLLQSFSDFQDLNGNSLKFYRVYLI